MTDTSTGFRYRGRKSGGAPTIQNIAVNSSITLTAGDLVSLTSNKLQLGATSQTSFLGVCLESKAGTGGTTKYRVIVDSDAIYGVYDNNARGKGATLDIAGATGAQTVAASSNKEFVVFATKLNNSDETLVCFNVGKHVDLLAQ